MYRTFGVIDRPGSIRPRACRRNFLAVNFGREMCLPLSYEVAGLGAWRGKTLFVVITK